MSCENEPRRSERADRDAVPPPSRPAWLFPPGYRGFPGKRWIGVLLRTLHLMGVAGLGGAFLYAAPREAWLPYLWLTVASGSLLFAIEIWSHGVWLLQLRGQAVILKLLLLGLMPATGPAAPWLLLAVVALSGIFSHAPARVRYYAPFHGRRMEVP